MSRTICATATVALLAAVSNLNAQIPYSQAPYRAYAAAPPQMGGAVPGQAYLPPPALPSGPDYRTAFAGSPAAPPSCDLPVYGACGAGGAMPRCTPGCAMNCAPSPHYWVASGGALFLTREAQDPYTFSYDSANEADQYVDAADADMDFAPGVTATIGRYNCCTNVGWEVTYWQLFPDSETTQQLGAPLTPGFLDGIRNYDQLDYSGGGVGDGASAADNVNAAQVHRLTRDWEVYNIEANRVLLFKPGSCGSPWTFQSRFGFRFFKFDESLLFVSDPSETLIDGDPDEYRIDIRTDNNLYGFQVGGVSQRRCASRWSVRLVAQAGLFINDAELDYFEGGSAGAATINNGPNAGQLTRVHANDDDLAFLGEFGVGATYQFSSAWQVGADYRVIGVTGLALPTDQIYPDTRGINDVRVLDNDGSLLLHGAFVRLTRCF